MLPKSTVADVMALAMGRAVSIAPDARGVEARRALRYYDEIGYQATDLTAKLRDQHADPAIWDKLPKNCINLVRPITDTLCTLYNDPVSYTWDESVPGGKAAAALWAEQKLAGVHVAAMKDVDRITFLAGLAAPRPLVQERERAGATIKIPKYAVYALDQIEFVQMPDDPAEAQQVKFNFATGQGSAKTTAAQVWADNLYLETTEGNTVKPPIYAGHANPYGIMPFEFFRNRPARGDFYGEPAQDLVEAQLAINDLLTGYRDTVIVQGSGTFYIVNGPDNPKLGRRAVLDVKLPPNAGTFDAGYVQSGTNFAAWVEAIKLQMTLMLLQRRVPESEVMATQNGDSGVALVALASSLAAYRKERIATFRPLEERLVQIALRVVNFHVTGQLIDFPAPQIKYTELRAPMAQDARDEIDWLLSHHMISEVEAMCRLNPGMTEPEAEQRLADNLKAKRERVLTSMADRKRLPAPKGEEDDVDVEAEDVEDEGGAE